MAQMQGLQAQDTRRHPDGSIDMDFYRRRMTALQSAATQDGLRLKPRSYGLALTTLAALALVTLVTSLPRHSSVANADNAPHAIVADVSWRNN